MSLVVTVKAKGCLFRSKLEWRYSEFFDSLGIPWQHEPEPFDLSSSSRMAGFPKQHCFYLPDFYLPSFAAYLEVKPRLKNPLAKHKLRALADLTGRVVYMSENFYASPPEFWWYNPVDRDECTSRKDTASFFVCSHCQSLGIVPNRNCSTKAHTYSCGTANYTHARILAALKRSKETLDETLIWKGKTPRRSRRPIRRPKVQE